jgi:hypothetical protein
MTPSLLSCALLLLLFQSHIIGTQAADIDTLAAALPATENSDDAHSLGLGVPGDRQVVAEAAGLQEQPTSCRKEHASCASQSISSMPLLATSTSSFIVLNVQLSDTADDAARIWKVQDPPLACVQHLAPHGTTP